MSWWKSPSQEDRALPVSSRDPSTNQQDRLASESNGSSADGVSSIQPEHRIPESPSHSGQYSSTKRWSRLSRAIGLGSDDSSSAVTNDPQHRYSSSDADGKSLSIRGQRNSTSQSESGSEISALSRCRTLVQGSVTSSDDSTDLQHRRSNPRIKSNRSITMTIRPKSRLHIEGISPTNSSFSNAMDSVITRPKPVSVTQNGSVERYVNEDGKVGVVICPNYGGGWSTFFHRDLEEARYNNDKATMAQIKHTIEIMIFDKGVVKAVLESNRSKAIRIVRHKAGNLIDRMEKTWPLEIRWVDPAEEVFVHENDGKETLCMKRDLVLWNA